jgi:hypothetical protein
MRTMLLAAVLGFLFNARDSYQVPGSSIEKARLTLASVISAGQSKAAGDILYDIPSDYRVKVHPPSAVPDQRESTFELDFGWGSAEFYLKDCLLRSLMLDLRPEPDVKAVDGAVVDGTARAVILAAGFSDLCLISKDTRHDSPDDAEYVQFQYGRAWNGFRTATGFTAQIEARTGRLRFLYYESPLDPPSGKSPKIDAVTAQRLSDEAFSEKFLTVGEVSSHASALISGGQESRLESRSSRFLYCTDYSIPGYVSAHGRRTTEQCTVVIDGSSGRVLAIYGPYEYIGTAKPGRTETLTIPKVVELIGHGKSLKVQDVELGSCADAEHFSGSAVTMRSGRWIAGMSFDSKLALFRLKRGERMVTLRPSKGLADAARKICSHAGDR